jgi:hypothetical protein
VAFALANPAVYRLMHSSAVVAPTDAIDESFAILTQHLDRVALEGRLRTSVGSAAQMLMAATTGVALGLIGRPGHYADPATSARLREVVLAGLADGAEPPVGRGPRD